MKSTVAALACLLLAFAALAEELRPLPPLLRTLSDEVGVMSTEEGRRLSRSLEAVLERTGVRVVMVIAETTQPEPIESYGERLARRWWRERQLDVEHSVFIVLAVRDREMQVMPGKALPDIERDLERAGTLRGLPPLFRAGRYFEALMKLNTEIERLLSRPAGRT